VPTRPDRIRQAAALLAEALTIVATTTRLLLRALRLLLSAIRALAAAVARGGRARPPARQLGRPNPAGWS
jgi:hypothetical protein